MGRKSPFTDWVFDAWDELVLDKGDRLSLEERRRRWRDLYGRTYQNGKWIVGVDDASLVAGLGDDLAMMSGEYQAARDLLRQFFAHPDLTVEHLIRYHESLFIREAMADMLCGNIDPAIERLRTHLFDPNRKKVFLNVVRHDLINLVNTLGLDSQVDPRLAQFTADVVGCYPGLVGLARAVPTYATYAELNDALGQTFGR